MVESGERGGLEAGGRREQALAGTVGRHQLSISHQQRGNLPPPALPLSSSRLTTTSHHLLKPVTPGRGKCPGGRNYWGPLRARQQRHRSQQSEWTQSGEREPPRHSKPVSPVWQSVAVNTPDTQTDRETQRETPTTHLTERSGCEGNGKSESQISDSHEYSDYEITTVGNYYGAIRVRQHHGIFTKVSIEYIERLNQSILIMKDIDSEVGRTRGVVSSVLFWRNCVFMSELI